MSDAADLPPVRGDPTFGDLRRLLGVGAVSFVQLGFELLFVKLTYYEFGATAHAVVGLALLGVALAGPATRLLGGPPRATDRALFLLPLTAFVTGVLLFRLEHRAAASTSVALRVLTVGGSCLLSLAMTAVPVFVEMRRLPQVAHRVYSASLIGAAAGVVATLGVLEIGGDAGAYAALLGACAVAIVVLSSGRMRRASVVASALAAVASWFAFPRLDVAAHPRSIYAASDAVSRIDVRPELGGALRFRTAGINTSTMTAPTDPGERAAMSTMPVTLPFHSAPRRVLIIGSGGGRNVVEALDLGAAEVVAVEINRMIPEYMRQRLEVRDDPYRDPRVRLIVGEGREAAVRLLHRIRKGDPPFDLVYAPVATFYGSSGQPVVETYLMTKEALSLYLAMVAPGGMVSTFFGGSELHQIAAAFSGALVEHGLPPAAHLALVRFGSKFALLARPGAPLSNDERVLLARTCPGGTLVDIEQELALNSRALTDDAPYFRGGPSESDSKFTLMFHRVGFTRDLLFAALAALSATLVAAGVRFRGVRAHSLGYASAFAAMGVAYSVIQTVAMQRLGFLLGHPLLGVAVVLPSTLLGTALGARIAGRLSLRHLHVFRASSMVLLLVLTALAAFGEPRALLELGLDLAARVVVGALAALAPFLVVGTFFPLAFARVEAELPSATEGCWVANGVGAVVGSLFTVYGGMRLGFGATLAVPAALYVALAAWDVLARKPRWARAADFGVALGLVTALGTGVWVMERAARMLE